MADINLIPQEEKQQQAKEKAVKNSTIVSIAVFLLVLAVSGYVFYTTATLNAAILERDGKIAALRNDIEFMSGIEISARNLGQKSETLQNILKTRPYYSKMLVEFEKRIPETVTIDNFSVGRDNTINVSGSGIDYISIARFIQDLASQNSLFTGVALNSVNLDAQNGRAAFFIVITFDPALLRK